MNNLKIDFIKTLQIEDYKLFNTYMNLDEVVEVLRGHYLLGTKDTPIAIKINGINNILFKSITNGIFVDNMAIERNGIFELYELSMNAYNRFEEFIRKSA